MEKCPFCGEHPFEYVDVGVAMVPVAVVCCDWGIMYFQHGKTRHQIHVMMRAQKREMRQTEFHARIKATLTGGE